MSDPRRPLDYAGPRPREESFSRRDRDVSAGMFVIGLLMGPVVLLIFMSACRAAVATLTYSWGPVSFLLMLGFTIASEIAIAVLIDRRCVNRGLIAGLLTFYGLALLLVGGCFCLFAASYH